MADVTGREERRVLAGRRVAPAPEPILERRQRDRRIVRSAPPSGDRVARSMPPALAQGWLAFQSGTARRRLSPIPDGWATRADGELVQLCHEAHPVPPAMRPVPAPGDAAPTGEDAPRAAARASGDGSPVARV